MSARFNPLCSRTNQEAYAAVQIKKHSVIKVVTIKTDGGTTKSTLFAVSKDEGSTKEDTGKIMKNALYVLWYAKRHLSG